MQGASDALLVERCKLENRIIVTVDMGFADIRSYKPKDYSGIIVLRVRDQSRQSVVACFKKVLPALAGVPITGLLWVVTERRIRLRGLAL
jgi:predicted nuclease of predicted toxin-antitoxin system